MLGRIIPADEDFSEGLIPPTRMVLGPHHVTRLSPRLALCDWRRFTEVGLGGWGDSSATKRVMKVRGRGNGLLVPINPVVYHGPYETAMAMG